MLENKDFWIYTVETFNQENDFVQFETVARLHRDLENLQRIAIHFQFLRQLLAGIRIVIGFFLIKKLNGTSNFKMNLKLNFKKSSGFDDK